MRLVVVTPYQMIAFERSNPIRYGSGEGSISIEDSFRPLSQGGCVQIIQSAWAAVCLAEIPSQKRPRGRSSAKSTTRIRSLARPPVLLAAATGGAEWRPPLFRTTPRAGNGSSQQQQQSGCDEPLPRAVTVVGSRRRRRSKGCWLGAAPRVSFVLVRLAQAWSFDTPRAMTCPTPDKPDASKRRLSWSMGCARPSNRQSTNQPHRFTPGNNEDREGSSDVLRRGVIIGTRRAPVPPCGGRHHFHTSESSQCLAASSSLCACIVARSASCPLAHRLPDESVDDLGVGVVLGERCWQATARRRSALILCPSRTPSARPSVESSNRCARPLPC